MSSAIGIIDSLVSFYELLIFVYIILSWFPVRDGIVYEVYQVIGSVCEPYIGLFRRIVPVVRMGAGGLDLSPLVAYLVLEFIVRGMILPLLG